MNNTFLMPHYRIVVSIVAPYVMRDKKTATFFGYCIDLLLEMQKAMNFTYELYEVTDGQIGVVDANGSWNGMVRDVMDEKADIGLSLIYHIADRETAVDFTLPIDDFIGFRIMMGKPKELRNFFEFVTILDYKIWLCIMASYFSTCLFLWVFDKWSPFSYRNTRCNNDMNEKIFTFKECLWFCLMCLTPQGCGQVPRNLSSKLITATWWVFVYIILSTYNANLAVFLTESGTEVTISSLDDLINQQKIQYGVIANSASYHHFENLARIEDKFYNIWVEMTLSDSISSSERMQYAVWDYPYKNKYTTMVETMKSYGLPSDLDEALDRIRNSNIPYALIDAAARVKYLTLSNCDYVMIGNEFNMRPVSLIVQKGSTLTKELNHVIHKLSLRGELQRLHKKWWDNITIECEEKNFLLDPIDFHTIGGAFSLIFIGVMLGYFGIFIEFLFRKHTSKYQQCEINVRSLKLGHRPAPVSNYKNTRE